MIRTVVDRGSVQEVVNSHRSRIAAFSTDEMMVLTDDALSSELTKSAQDAFDDLLRRGVSMGVGDEPFAVPLRQRHGTDARGTQPPGNDLQSASRLATRSVDCPIAT